MIDLDAYLARIGLRGRPTVTEIHRAHATTIAFENLDPRRGVPVSLEPEDLERKLVHDRRGGYCFEHNLLLAAALEALGHEVDLMLARVRSGAADDDALRPRTHLALRVRDGDTEWHADVGFGDGTPIEPVPFGTGDEHDILGWGFRVVAEGDLLVLRGRDSDGWSDLYALDPTPVPRVDCVVSSWYTSTWPRSPFVTGLVVALAQQDGTRVALRDRCGELTLTTETPRVRTVTPVAPAAAAALVESRFGLDPSLLDRA